MVDRGCTGVLEGDQSGSVAQSWIIEAWLEESPARRARDSVWEPPLTERWEPEHVQEPTAFVAVMVS
jgi:hypothetical protein